MQMTYERFKWKTEGKALPQNIVTSGSCRFTVLTERLIRIEYDSAQRFTDEASQVGFYRNFPESSFTVSESDGVTEIKNEYLTLKYKTGSCLTKETLSVELRQAPSTKWNFGEEIRQLKGTACTLDGINGALELEDGVCSRGGITVLDDSRSLLLTEDGWFKNREAEETDCYVFAYGHDYKGCIADFYRLTGIPPLLPAYALGNWWSRYHRYTQREYCDLIERFQKEKIPFSVAVVDMDWHTLNTPKEAYIDDPRFIKGWTGYSWNKELFPNYKEFLRFLKEHGLKIALNLHPSNGIGCHEDMYEKMALACGVDHKTKKLIKFDVLNPEFMEKYFDILLHPYEKDGVDFWWMDWQQGDDYWWVHDDEHPRNELETMSPLWLINHLHILDIMRNGKRPMFFSRYSGPGSHRYPVGFSGDTIVTWESLDFQPYFTATASNIGYGWWSHDIGGHMNGYRDDELQVRWLQFGVFSPINRLHSSNHWFTGKEPWNLNDLCKGISEDWLRLRHKLFPYIYTMNYCVHKDLEPLIRPLYYTYPDCNEAYSFKNQYWFGSELLVAPITSGTDSSTMMSSVDIWFPKGKWIDFFTGLIYSGEKTVKVHRDLSEYSVFAKAGAIVPTENYSGDNTLGNKTDMTVYVFPGADNSFVLYEDSGDGNGYKNGEYATTEFSLNWGETAVFTIHSAQGETSLIPENRNWTVLFRGFSESIAVKTFVNGKETECKLSFDKKTNTASVSLENIPTRSEIVFEISGENSLETDNSSAKDRIFDILMHSQMSYAVKGAVWQAVERNEKNIYNFCPEQEHKALLGAVDEMLNL